MTQPVYKRNRMSNSISTITPTLLREELAPLEIAERAFGLGVRMATLMEPFDSPFEDESLSSFWEAGYLEQVYARAWTIGSSWFHPSGNMVRCPYNEPHLIRIWNNGLNNGLEVTTYEAELAKRRQRGKRQRRKVDWQIVGF
jgi:hypothetical protein